MMSSSADLTHGLILHLWQDLPDDLPSNDISFLPFPIGIESQKIIFQIQERSEISYELPMAEVGMVVFERFASRRYGRTIAFSNNPTNRGCILSIILFAQELLITFEWPHVESSDPSRFNQ